MKCTIQFKEDFSSDEKDEVEYDQDVSTSKSRSFDDSAVRCIIHHIAKAIINKTVKNEKFQQKFRGNNIRLEYIDSMNCDADNTVTSSATIRLGIHLLEDMWIICHDVYNSESLVKSIYLSKDSNATDGLVNSFTFEEDTAPEKIFEHIIDSDSLGDSLDSISFEQAYKAFEIAVKFVFLHECGHVYLNHRKTNVYEEEKLADKFAEELLKEEVIGNLDLEKSTIEGIIIALAIILMHEDFSLAQDHPWAIERILDAFNIYENCIDDEFTKFSYELIQHIVIKKKCCVAFPQLDSNKYIETITEFFNELPEHI